MRSDDISEMILDMRHEVIETIVFKSIPEQSYHDQWDSETLATDVKNYLGITVPIIKWTKEDGIIEKEIISRLIELSNNFMAERAVKFGIDVFRQAEKTLLLQVLDQGWKEHLLMLDQMRQSIGLRAYAQKDPLNEYKKEAFDLFSNLLEKLKLDYVTILMNLKVVTEQTKKEDNNTEILTTKKSKQKNGKK